MSCSMIRRALLLGAALPLLSWAADSALRIDAPYVRLAPPSAPASAAFMVIGNTGNAPRKLIKAQRPVARAVELHNHVNDNGVMKMREVPSIEIKAKSQAELKPGGYHIMLIDLRQALKEGDLVPITLTFDDGSSLPIDAPERKTAAPAAPVMNHGAIKH